MSFGTSGWLYQSNKLMYDRSTNTLWHQFRGEPVVGPLADSGIKLEVLPVTVTTWSAWAAAHPDTTVLDINTGVYPPESYAPESDPGSVYSQYRRSDDVMFPVWQKSDQLPTKAQVFGLTLNDQARAYPLEVLRTQPVINDALGGQNLVVVTPGEAGGSRAYQRGALRFAIGEPDTSEAVSVVLVDEAGDEWRMEEEALVNIGDPSQRLSRLPSHTSYWFGWYAFYPTTDVYRQE